MEDVTVQGLAEPRFASVAREFRAGFAHRGEVGAALAVYVHGRPVLDLWGGLADPGTGRRWERDTVQVVWSATKGLVATCLAMLVDRGRLDYADPVCRHWPEFAQAGKRDVTVGELLSHQAGLPYLDEPVPFAVVAVPDALSDRLARQRPFWKPGTAVGYHAVTWGFYAGELVRRVAGRSVGAFLAEEVAGPLGVSAYIGTPPDAAASVARLVPAPDAGAGWLPGSDLARALLAVPELALPGADHDPAVLALEIPSGLGVTNARALARVYAVLAAGGTHGGVRLMSPAAVKAATATAAEGPDRILGELVGYAQGFMKPSTAFFRISADPEAFGHPGSGGSLAFADPAAGLAFAYVTNAQSAAHTDGRALSLVAAVHRALGA